MQFWSCLRFLLHLNVVQSWLYSHPLLSVYNSVGVNHAPAYTPTVPSRQNKSSWFFIHPSGLDGDKPIRRDQTAIDLNRSFNSSIHCHLKIMRLWSWCSESPIDHFWMRPTINGQMSREATMVSRRFSDYCDLVGATVEGPLKPLER